MRDKCARCNQKISVSSNSEKYCKDCAYIVKLETKKIFNKKAKYAKLYKLGTGNLGSKPLKNFTHERKAIDKEMKRLGLRK